MAGMAVQVNELLIRDQCVLRAAQGREDVEIWILLDGYWIDADSHRAVLSLLTDAGVPCVLADHQSPSGGTLVAVAADAVDSVVAAVRRLDVARGGPGAVVSAEGGLNSELFRLLRQVPGAPTLKLVLRMDPPVTAGPLNQHGQFDSRWSVPEPARSAVLDEVAAWLQGVARDGPVLASGEPVERDLRELLDRRLSQRPYSVDLTAGDLTTERVRSATFNTWGQLYLTSMEPAVNPLERAETWTDLIQRHAGALDVAWVHHGSPLDPSAGAQPLWSTTPHVWTTYVADAYGIQLLTDDHLAKARDLSRWQVTSPAPGRWLVVAKDLERWFTDGRSEVEQEILDQARADFGGMILDPDVLSRHPRSVST
jgi:hypothetical protein